ncbi:MAG: hypothetical protein Q4C88_08855 [Akkermansia sp.]|nr:hypothetical protein [Akkermansia sp.]
MKKAILPTLALAALAAPLSAQYGEPLRADAQADSFAIAEQLYTQARGIADPTDRALSMRRAAELFGEYAQRYAGSAMRQKAMYYQALCLAEAGDLGAANAKLGVLANTCRGEYAASAAYKLATQANERMMWDKALGFYRIAVRETQRPELRHDAMYRCGNVQLQMGRRKDAEETFKGLQVLKGVKPLLQQSAVFAIAQMKVEDGNDSAAYAQFRSLLGMPGLDAEIAGKATLQAARLAARLGRNDESQQLYAKLTGMPGMAKYAAEAQMERIVALFKEHKYAEVVRLADAAADAPDDPAKAARRAVIVGQSCLELKQYDRAVDWFAAAEQAQPGSALAADAGYRRIICAQQIAGQNFFHLAEKYLGTYAVAGTPTADLPCVDLVRLMYADRLMLFDAEAAARQFDALNMDQIPEVLRADTEYKKAWTAAQGDNYDPLPALEHFISTYTQDPRVPDALAIRGAYYAKTHRVPQALADFDRVIRDYPQSEACAVCYQKAAQACTNTDPKRMVQYYEGLIKYYSDRVQRGGHDKPAAIAEAHYNIACALYETDPSQAVPHFREARTMNAEQYASMVDLRLVQCYFKMKDTDNLRQALKALKEANPSTYEGLPPAILRWCGWSCFQARNYPDAHTFLTDALLREPREKYTAADGKQYERPRVEPIVWKTLAKTRLELRQYQAGLEAAQFYVSMETQPYRKAEGMCDEAQLLIALYRTAEAKKVCEEAISIGIDGPIKSSLFLTMGDAWYSEGKYADAAKYYGRTANVVSDKELKPLALYKITCALLKCGKEGEAQPYGDSLRNEFPGWVAPANVRELMERAPQQSQPAPQPQPQA